MKAVGLITLLAGLTLGSQAHALVIPVSEPNMLSLLGLGGLIAVLVVRYLRR